MNQICIKVNESRCKQYQVTPQFSTGQIYLKNLKINIDSINWEKHSDRSADKK